MCAIIDANSAHEVFGSKCTKAGEKFVEWINSGSGRLVVGGKLLEELFKSSAVFRRLGQQLQLSGKMTIVNKDEINARTDQLLNEDSCGSNDQHIIALAQVSGARLLYSDDGDLLEDFKNKRLINNPRGKVYAARGDGSLRDGRFEPSHDRLLKRRNLCRTGP